MLRRSAVLPSGGGNVQRATTSGGGLEQRRSADLVLQIVSNCQGVLRGARLLSQQKLVLLRLVVFSNRQGELLCGQSLRREDHRNYPLLQTKVRRKAELVSIRMPSEANAYAEECSTLCMYGVPAYFTCRELINFVAPMASEIQQMFVSAEGLNSYCRLCSGRLFATIRPTSTW